MIQNRSFHLFLVQISLGFTAESVRDAMSLGPDLLTDSRFALHHDARRVAVAYQLLLDRRRRTEQDMNPIRLRASDADEAIAAAAARHRFKHRGITQTPTAAASGSVTPQSGVSSPSARSPPGPDSSSGSALPALSLGTSSSATDTQITRRWFVGVWTTCDPATVMADVFRALKVLGFVR
jgi:hypothetical protein